MKVSVDLTFNGNCLEAMTFYQACFGGELQFQKLSDSVHFSGRSELFRNYILHASLKCTNLILLASDMIPEESVSHGNTMRIVLSYDRKELFFHVYQKLSEEAVKNSGVKTTAYQGMIASLSDRYEINWLLILTNNGNESSGSGIEIFRTSVTSQESANKLVSEIHLLFPHVKANFDLDDCDHILRIKGKKIDSEAIAGLLKRRGFQCLVLN